MQIALQLESVPGAPAMRCHGRVNDLGRLVCERIASIAVDWPAIGFQRIEPDTTGLRITIATNLDVPAAVVVVALARAIRRETGDLVGWSGQIKVGAQSNLSS